MVTLVGTGTVQEAVDTTAVYNLAVNYGGMPLYTHQGPACGNTTVSLPLNVGTVNIDGLTCPVSSGGAINMEVQVNLPSIVPSGAYAIHIRGDNGADEIFCIYAQFDL